MQAATMDSSLYYDAWLAVNAAFCIRHRCRLTVVDCDRQRLNSQGIRGDLRCQGCEGLNNQPEAIDHIGEYGTVRPQLLSVSPVYKGMPELSPAEIEDAELKSAARISEQAVPGIGLDLDCLNNLGNVGDALDLDNLNALVGDNGALARELQLLFMCDDEEVETQAEIAALFKETKDRREKSKRYAVYQGRCHRCGGYMDNTRENQFMEKWDDDVYRCLACGWRTSPAYAWNRNNLHLADWRG